MAVLAVDIAAVRERHCAAAVNQQWRPEQAMGRWVMGQCMLTHDPPLFNQPSKSQ